MTVQDAIAQLSTTTTPKRVRDGWVMTCPFHADTNPSFKLWDNGGWYCMGCEEGGNLSRLLEMLNGRVTTKGLLHSSTRQRDTSSVELGVRVMEYVYRDENGGLLYKVVRFMPKSFRQMRWTPAGWEWGLRGVRRVLYNLDLIAKHPSETVVMVEGEKDADLLTRHGILATTCPMGAGKWRAEYGESVKGRKVILIPDNDEVGVLHMTAIATYLNKNKIADARLVRIPGKYKDVSEWGQVDKVKELLEAEDAND